MPIVFLEVVRALWALRRNAGFVSLGILVLFAITGGAGFYWQVEDLAILDALYLSVITLTTVGYGDVAPATAVGKMFTSVFVIFGMGLLVAFLSTLAAHIREHNGVRRRLAAHASDQAQAVPAVGEYDLLVVGSDDESRRTALAAAESGLRVVLVEPGRLPELADSRDAAKAAGSGRRMHERQDHRAA